MNPTIVSAIEENEVFHFTLTNINVSLANALRRIILSELPTVVFYTEIYKDNQCTIEENTSRLHNEILKQRLSCIPIHSNDLHALPGKYYLEIDVTNETDNMRYVTTEDFQIKPKLKEDGSPSDHPPLSEDEVRKIFPKNSITQSYIDFARLRPRITDTIPGEKLKLKCEFSISTAKVSSTFNVVSKCAYANTPDHMKVKEIWEDHEAKLIATDVPKDDIAFQKKNFHLLDAQRYFVEDSFDFVIQSVGVYDNREIVKKACVILYTKFAELIQHIDADNVSIMISETAINHCFDIVLENEDYTMGKVIEYIMYQTYYLNEKTLTFCGFKKMHPHDADSIVRIAFKDPLDKTTVKQYLRKTCVDAQEIFKRIMKLF
jgi:DNA-directed RNA polymerase alpha subunit/DNA-directed RNA polymerase subunit L